MTTFDEREKGFENKFIHDQELQFKVYARRNKLLGLWAAEQMGLTGTQAESYAREVVSADFEEAGDEDVFRKVLKDLQAKGASIDEKGLRKAMADLLAKAKQQVQKGS